MNDTNDSPRYDGYAEFLKSLPPLPPTPVEANDSGHSADAVEAAQHCESSPSSMPQSGLNADPPPPPPPSNIPQSPLDESGVEQYVGEEQKPTPTLPQSASPRENNEDADKEYDDDEFAQEEGEEYEEEEEYEPPIWEDFMAHYWRLPTHVTTETGDNSQQQQNVSPEFQIHSHAQTIFLQEDTDLKTCPLEPELDEVPPITSLSEADNNNDGANKKSPGVTSSSSIDMDDGKVGRDAYYTHIGLEYTRMMAKLYKNGELNLDETLIDEGDAISSGNKDVGSQSNGSTQQNRQQLHEKSVNLPQQDQDQQYQQQQPSPETKSTSPQHASNAQAQDFSLASTASKSFDVKSDASSTDYCLMPSATRSFDTRSDIRSEASSHDENPSASTPNMSNVSKSLDKSTGGTLTTNSKASVAEWPHKMSPLPSASLIHSTGPILTRTSLRSLVMKKWHPSYWMHYGPHTLLVFRSKDHLDDWMHNPYHGKKQREYLVKLRIDFYGEMVGSGGGSGGVGGGVEGVLGHRALPIKKKSYGKNEPEMHQFKLERWTNIGVTVIAAFASQEESEVNILHKTIVNILKSCPYGGLRNIDHMLKK